MLELRKFFANAYQTSARRSELPTIEKYASFSDGNDRFATAVDIVRKFPQALENLPHVAVMTANGTERKLTIGPPYMALVQEAPRLVAALPEPYALADGDVITFRTLPDGRHQHLDIITFTANRFPTGTPITAALAVDVARVINEQSARTRASVVNLSGQNYVQVAAGGVIDARESGTPTEIEASTDVSLNAQTVLGFSRTGDITDIGGTVPSMTLTGPSGRWSSADVGRYLIVSNSDQPVFNDGRFLITGFSAGMGTDTLTYLNKYGRSETGSPGTWFIGLRDDYKNPVRPPKHRYAHAMDMSAQIDVFCEDDNTRGELVDLVLGFFTFFLESKYFTFFGRSTFDRTITSEWYQTVINPPMQSSSESEFPRPGDGSGKIYVNSFVLNLTTSMYLDREVIVPGTTNTPFILDSSNFSYDETLPFANPE